MDPRTTVHPPSSCLIWELNERNDFPDDFLEFSIDRYFLEPRYVTIQEKFEIRFSRLEEDFSCFWLNCQSGLMFVSTLLFVGYPKIERDWPIWKKNLRDTVMEILNPWTWTSFIDQYLKMHELQTEYIFQLDKNWPDISFYDFQSRRIIHYRIFANSLVRENCKLVFFMVQTHLLITYRLADCRKYFSSKICRRRM